MKILLMSRYDSLGASSRVRSYQYLPYLRDLGISVTVAPLFSNAYLQALYNKRSTKREVIKGYSKRLLNLFSVYKYDLIIIEKELFPFFPALFERLLTFFGIPYLVDYDDALFHRYDTHKSALVRALLGKKIDTVMKKAAVVVAGNRYLADRAEHAGAKKVVIIPSVVDTEHYMAVVNKPDPKELTIGWIGTPKTSDYLVPLIPVFQRLVTRFNIRFVAIGANAKDFDGTPVRCWPWSQESEVEAIQQLDIGIMPLKDSAWERGKCGYKLIQYMACGLPVVASPVGVNAEIVNDGINGYLANTDNDWEKALEKLCSNSEVREQMGLSAREKVEKLYSIKAQKQRFLTTIKRAAGICTA